MTFLDKRFSSFTVFYFILFYFFSKMILHAVTMLVFSEKNHIKNTTIAESLHKETLVTHFYLKGRQAKQRDETDF